jgi:ankyrin repeat protein
LLGAGADVNAKNADGVTALWIAAYGGHRDAVEALLAAGADPNVKAKDFTVLKAAMGKGHGDIAEVLKKAGAKE